MVDLTQAMYYLSTKINSYHLVNYYRSSKLSRYQAKSLSALPLGVISLCISLTALANEHTKQHEHKEQHVEYQIHQEHQDHSNHHNSATTLSLNAGEKWPIDPSLHQGMSMIKRLMSENIDDIHYDKFSAQQFKQLASELDLQLKYLFKNCKLPPLADAQLHTLLAGVLQASHQMKQPVKQKQGAITVIKALQSYEQYFDDPKWQPLVH